MNMYIYPSYGVLEHRLDTLTILISSLSYSHIYFKSSQVIVLYVQYLGQCHSRLHEGAGCSSSGWQSTELYRGQRSSTWHRTWKQTDYSICSILLLKTMAPKACHKTWSSLTFTWLQCSGTKQQPCKRFNKMKDMVNRCRNLTGRR